MKHKPAKKFSDIQTGKTLPNKVTAYRPNYTHHSVSSQNRVTPPEQPSNRKSIWKKLVLIVILVIFTVAVFIAVWDARNISTASQKLFGSGSYFDLLSRQPLVGSERGRVNVLLVGYSIDDPGHPAATLTDSIILLSMNTVKKTGYMLSIPRDLYVNIPGFGYAKINEAYKDGGIKLLEKVVSTNFNSPIDYYALINYSSVRDTVNALGGISVKIQSTDPNGLYDPNISKVDGGPLKLSNGLQTLDGQTALNLTRARGDAYGSYGFAQADFDRTQNQRLVLAAIKSKLNWKLVLNPRKNSQILNAVANNVKTNVPATNARALFGSI